MSHVRYIDKTREYYLGEGYDTPYHWAHFGDVPFTPLAKPLARCRVGLVTTSEIVIRGREDDLARIEDDPTCPVYSLPLATPVKELYGTRPPWRTSTRFQVVHSQYSQRRTLTVDAPLILAQLREDRVDVAVLTAV